MITIGSLIVIALLLFGLIRYKSYTKYYVYLIKTLIVFSVYIQIGYFVQIGSLQVEYAEVLTILAIIVGIPLLKNVRIPVLSLLLTGGLVFTILIGFMHLIYTNNPPIVLPVGGSWDLLLWGQDTLSTASFSLSNILRIIRIIVFLMLYFVLDKFLLRDNEKSNEMKSFVVNSGLFFAGLGIIEQITKTLLNSTIFIDFTTNIFGIAESQVTVNFERGGVFALQGLTHEPSIFAFSFLPAILILMTSNLFSEKKRFWSLAVFIYVVLSSSSFAGFALTALFLVSYLISNRKVIIHKIYLFIVVGITSMTILAFDSSTSNLFSYYIERVISFLNGGGYGSENSRLYSIENAVNLFKEYPFFGIGIGTTDVHGFIPTLLASLGLIGSVLWFLIMLRGFENSRNKKKELLIFMLPFLFFTGSLRTVYSVDMILIFLFVFREYRDLKEPSKNRPLMDLS